MNSAFLIDRELVLAADILDDIERVRVANDNRLLIMTRSEEDSDGEVRGWGFDPMHESVIRITAMVDGLKELESEAEKNLTKLMKAHPLGKWVKQQKGIGDKQAARLIAAIGDPYWHNLENRPRTVAELWSYSGYSVLSARELPAEDINYADLDISVPGGGVAVKRRKGHKANWSTKAKTRAYLVAMSCLKQLVKPCARIDEGAVKHVDECICSPYRVIYDDRRAHTAETHPEWTLGRSHNDAVRKAAKEILKGLYNASKELHEANQ